MMFQQDSDKVMGMSELSLKKRMSPLILSGVVILLDQFTKALVVMFIPYRTVGFSLWRGFFRLIYVKNTGVAFSMGDQLPHFARIALFILIPLGIMGYLAYYLVHSREETILQKYCLAGIVGGGLGNLIDRIFRPDGVVDFLDIRFYGLFGMERFPTFNIADSAIVLCGILLFVSLWIKEKNTK